jgi:hypothetical protein
MGGLFRVHGFWWGLADFYATNNVEFLFRMPGESETTAEAKPMHRLAYYCCRTDL